MKLDYPRLAIVAGSVLVVGGIVIGTQQPTALDTELFQNIAWARNLSPTTSPLDLLGLDTGSLLTTVPQTDKNCLDCHTDLNTLKKLAKETEPTESLSSGEG